MAHNGWFVGGGGNGVGMKEVKKIGYCCTIMCTAYCFVFYVFLSLLLANCTTVHASENLHASANCPLGTNNNVLID